MIKLEETYGNLDYFIDIYDHGIRIQQTNGMEGYLEEVFIPASIFKKIIEELIISGFESQE